MVTPAAFGTALAIASVVAVPVTVGTTFEVVLVRAVPVMFGANRTTVAPVVVQTGFELAAATVPTPVTTGARF
uniref:Putative secreted protein n=1 Tax=Ixodes ricinus TaxID=34613 RepID=A0A6B0UA67_IXORI